MGVSTIARSAAPAATATTDEAVPCRSLLPSLTEAGNLREDFHRYVSGILRDTCNLPEWAALPWIPLPERSPVFDTFFGDVPYEKVVKADMIPDPNVKGKYIYQPTKTPDIKAKTAEGYVWVDGDPIAILANKYGNLRSCHTLDNGQYSGGNFAHLYNPYFACVFAGAADPSTAETLKPANSSATERRLTIDGNGQFIRNFQATANLYLVRDREQRPWIILSRLYDSCASEFGWRKTIERFLIERARKRGWGVACAWYRDAMAHDRVGYTAAGDTDSLRTPPFVSGTGRNNVISHYDDAGVFRMYRDGTHTLLVSEAQILLQPTAKGGADTDLLPLADFDRKVYGTSTVEQFYEVVQQSFMEKQKVSEIEGYHFSTNTLNSIGNIFYRLAQERFEAGAGEEVADYATARNLVLEYLRSDKGHTEQSKYGLSLSPKHSDAHTTEDGQLRATAIHSLLSGRFASDKWREQHGAARKWWVAEEKKRKEEIERRRFDELKHADFLRKMQEVNQMFVAQRAAAPAGAGVAAG